MHPRGALAAFGGSGRAEGSLLRSQPSLPSSACHPLAPVAPRLQEVRDRLASPELVWSWKWGGGDPLAGGRRIFMMGWGSVVGDLGEASEKVTGDWAAGGA